MSDTSELTTQAAVGELKGTVTSLKEQVGKMDEKLDAVVSYIDQQKGARNAARWVASILGAIFGAGASAALEYFRTKHGG